MNMILDGIEAPNIIHTNTLTENLADVQEKDRYDVVMANPPFGGKERAEVQQNFPIRTGETAFLFLQHFIKMIKAGGRGGVVIKNTFLSNTDNAAVARRGTLYLSQAGPVATHLKWGSALPHGISRVRIGGSAIARVSSCLTRMTSMIDEADCADHNWR